MFIEVTRLQFQLVWCSVGGINEAWYLYVVGEQAHVERALPLGVVRKQRKTGMWAATSYGDNLESPIVVVSRRKACAMAAVGLFRQLFQQPAAIAEQQLRSELFDDGDVLASRWADIKTDLPRMESVCLLK